MPVAPNWLIHNIRWNPQLWLEVKSRLTVRHLLVTSAASLTGQFLLWGSLQKQAGFAPVVELQFHLFHRLTWVMLLLLMAIGSYWLVKDLSKEYRRGTFTLIRLSPQASRSILLGKLLGVPILLYLAMALAIPLHLWAALSGGVSLQTLLMVYLFFAIVNWFTYTYGLVYVLGWGAKTQPWYVQILVCSLFLVLLGLWHFWGYFWRDSWQHLWWTDGFLLMCITLLISLCAAGIKLWHMCLYRFHHPPLSNP